MNNTIVLVSSNRIIEAELKDCIGNDYLIYKANMSNLMVELYQIDAKALIVDLDEIDEHTIEIIKSIISLEYLPVIYINMDNTRFIDEIKDEIVIPFNKIRELIKHLLKQCVVFKDKYNNITESYDAIELINGEVKSSLKENSKRNYINGLIDLVFLKNMFITKKPETIWILYKKEKGFQGSLYEKNGENYIHKQGIFIGDEDRFSFDIYAVNGFMKNFDFLEISDINFKTNNFPSKIREKMDNINNFCGFSVENHTIIAMNYNDYITNYDLGIIKTLSINIDLISTIRHQIDELDEAFQYTVNALARASEVNDNNTGSHIKRVNSFAKRIAEELGYDKEFVEEINYAAQMHDVGKIYVDKDILLKPGKLTDEEFTEIKKHTTYGEKIIGDSKYLKMSAEIARNHHEKYDGTGYPDGKKGDEIPIAARIVFLADIYDALRSPRPYKNGLSHQDAYTIITKGDGRVNPENFDPAVLEVFKRIHLDFNRIYMELKD